MSSGSKYSKCKPKDLIACPNCDARLRPNNLEKHLERVHPSVPESAAREKKELVACPKCDTRLKPQNLESHLQREHPSVTNPDATCSRCGKGFQRARPRLRLCPKCRAKRGSNKSVYTVSGGAFEMNRRRH